jgi:glutathione S-transferase
MNDKLTLIIGNKNYSSWSLRPWLLMRHHGIAFDEVRLPLDTPEFATGVERWSPSGRVPVLHRGDLVVWDSLAICEYVNETFLDGRGWPRDATARAVARSVSAEMHSGFQALRGKMPMNIRSRYPGKGMTPESRKDIDRIVVLWTECRERFGGGGSLLFGRFSVADAFFAPVVMRFHAYAVDVPRVAQEYCEAVQALAAVREWREAARRETEFVAEDEPYAQK